LPTRSGFYDLRLPTAEEERISERGQARGEAKALAAAGEGGAEPEGGAGAGAGRRRSVREWTAEEVAEFVRGLSHEFASKAGMRAK
jgi:hypothetical protein